MRGAACLTDYRLLRAMLNFHITPQRNKKPQLRPICFAVLKLRDTKVKETFEDKLKFECNFQPLASVEKYWHKLKDSVTKNSEEALGHSTRAKKGDWFDDNDPEIAQLLEQKKKPFTVLQAG